jgi:hypothetical protein
LLYFGGHEEDIGQAYPELASGLAADLLLPVRMGPVAARADAGRLLLEELV